MSEFGDWYRSIPEITKYWFTGSTVLPLLGRIGFLSAYYMLLEWNLFFYKFQVYLSGILGFPHFLKFKITSFCRKISLDPIFQLFFV